MSKGGRGKILRVAIAGQGRSGYSIHAEWLKKSTDNYKIVAVADQLPERRADAEREFGARAYKDYKELIKAGGFDLFVNALPSPLHVPASIKAMNAGFPVVCEKPMARTVKDFDKMVAASRKTGQLLAPFQNNRLQPFFLKILEVVKSGVLGEILHVRSSWSGFARRWDWQTIQCNMGGSLFNTGPHAIDQALMLFGEREEPHVFCRMKCNNKLGGDAEDFCSLTLYGEKSPQVDILLSSYQAYPQGDFYSISGTLGGLSGGHESFKWKYYDPKKAPKQKFWNTWSVDRGYPKETLPFVEKSWQIDDATAKGPRSGYTLPSFQSAVKAFYDNVHDAVVKDAKLIITLPQVRRQIAVLEEAHRQNKLPRKYRAWIPGRGSV